MKYPDSVITEDKKGNKEIRLLVDKGGYVRYRYMDPKTNKLVEKGKYSIILKTPKGEEQLYLIPIKGNRALVVYPKTKAKERKVWDKSKNKPENLF
ncbi:hypothetical protein KY345_05435 [Candidatus Woesearchaeota archaeon]|nr:hypothetical protein [Candidatus Woesearchaeota archaeon]